MTNREFLTAIANSEILPAEIVEHAAYEIEKMNAKNVARSSKPSKKQQENEPLLEKLASLFALDVTMTTAEAAAAMELSTQKVSALLRELVKRDILISEDVKVKGKGTQKQYHRILAESESAE